MDKMCRRQIRQRANATVHRDGISLFSTGCFDKKYEYQRGVLLLTLNTTGFWVGFFKLMGTSCFDV